VTKRGIRQRIVEEFSQWHTIQGIHTPKRIDQFINGRSSRQTFVLKISYNNNFPESTFAKPIPPK